jgi:hypothetical protein
LESQTKLAGLALVDVWRCGQVFISALVVNQGFDGVRVVGQLRLPP